MSASYSTNLVNVLTERSADLAAAQDPEKVRTMISAAEVEAQKRTEPAYISDRYVYRVTVWVLGFAVIIVAIAQSILAFKFNSHAVIPDGLIAIGSAAIGALAGLLAPTAVPANSSNGNGSPTKPSS